jgi:pantothenate synthetase
MLLCDNSRTYPPKAGNAPLVVLAASRLGATRLIDNIEI